MSTMSGRGVTGFQIIITIMFLFLAAVHLTFEETENYCKDQLVKVSPNDLELQRLHGLRLGICEKIEKESLSLKQGMAIFETEREKAILKRNREERGKKKHLVQ